MEGRCPDVREGASSARTGGFSAIPAGTSAADTIAQQFEIAGPRSSRHTHVWSYDEEIQRRGHNREINLRARSAASGVAGVMPNTESTCRSLLRSHSPRRVADARLPQASLNIPAAGTPE